MVNSFLQHLSESYITTEYMVTGVYDRPQTEVHCNTGELSIFNV